MRFDRINFFVSKHFNFLIAHVLCKWFPRSFSFIVIQLCLVVIIYIHYRMQSVICKNVILDTFWCLYSGGAIK